MENEILRLWFVDREIKHIEEARKNPRGVPEEMNEYYTHILGVREEIEIPLQQRFFGRHGNWPCEYYFLPEVTHGV